MASRDKEVRVINDQCRSLPRCPVCGYITDLVEVVIRRAKKPGGGAGGGRWVSYVLRCLNSVDPDGLRRARDPDRALCSFSIPMTFEP